ncbi:hypothetical protein RclHR1_29850001 [Rhizophagus clarus]|uniref:Uncharacterized protein n=1 Tax=Rhizophagus clarus TaxID=94130 RepID=A0A2Z6R5N4_9GLOM|nr:hypothetical protein RclHR1_29850001 [Rhizophagus clarus]
MQINPKKARETKDEWFEKRRWTLHTILLYTKDQNTNNLNINAYDYWSEDTKQDAWFTTSSLHENYLSTKITHAIKRYVKLDYEIASDEDIEMVIKGLSDTDAIENLENKMNELEITDVDSINETEVEIDLECKREPVKQIPIHIKNLLEIMFHAEENKVPKESTIANWITSFSQGWKHAMALQTIEVAEHISIKEIGELF